MKNNMVDKKNKNWLIKIKKWYNKKIKKNKLKLNLSESLILMVITFAIGLIIGGIVMYGKGPFGADKSFNQFIATYNEINDFYYKEVDSEKLLEAGIKGMINYLGDPYSSYMNVETAAEFNDEVEGVYHGIGAEIILKEDNKVHIGKVYENSPAAQAGLQENDILIKVNDQSVEGLSLNTIASNVKGEDGTSVTITIIRDEEEKNITLTRGTVDTISVHSETIEKENKKIGYLDISIFAANTYKQLEKELKNLEENKIDSLIIDLRNNQGGYLNSVTDIISLFIKKGLPIYELKIKDDIEIIYDQTDDERNYPIVVLVNSISASASEVLAGALQETYKATIMGTKSFGKGKVQKVKALPSGALVKYTYQEWLTPLGNYIDGKGITPDIEVKYTPNEKGEDNQKEEAINYLLGK